MVYSFVDNDILEADTIMTMQLTRYLYAYAFICLFSSQPIFAKYMIQHEKTIAQKEINSADDAANTLPHIDENIIADSDKETDSANHNDNNIITIPHNDEVDAIFERYDRNKYGVNYDLFINYSLNIAKKYNAGKNIYSVILKSQYTGGKPDLKLCAGQSLAVIVDIDQDRKTAVGRSARLAQINSLSAALNAIRAENITIIWLSRARRDQSENILAQLNPLGIVDDKDFLSLHEQSERKQLQRQYIAATYCVISILGDTKADFDELFQYVRNPNQFIDLNALFGKGWFVQDIPNLISE